LPPLVVPGVLAAAAQLTAATSLAFEESSSIGGSAYDEPAAREDGSYGSVVAALPLGAQLGRLSLLQRLTLQVDELQGCSCAELSVLTSLTSLHVGNFAGQVCVGSCCVRQPYPCMPPFGLPAGMLR